MGGTIRELKGEEWIILGRKVENHTTCILMVDGVPEVYYGITKAMRVWSGFVWAVKSKEDTTIIWKGKRRARSKGHWKPK